MLSVILAVGVAVAGNQILTEGRWSWWWTGIAVALTAASALVAYWLTRPPGDAPPSTAVPTAGSSGQVVENSTAGGNIDSLRGITGNVRLRETPPSAPASEPGPAEPGGLPQEMRPPAAGTVAGDAGAAGGGQRVSGSQAGGSITQIDGVGGDVTIERS
ncbi:hypothetical protein ABGB17_32035 [Sphaerisporangium sp. B11E5]|uniref:hypothetical protein n=1 Tax=Sphaerisporangium sp. B11E5 TaxID=3153563 RepID=UPI00325C602C